MRDTVSSRPRRTRRIVLWTLLSVVMVAVLAVGGITVYNQLNEDELPEGIPPRPAAIVADPQIKPVSPDAPTPSAAGVRKAIASSIKAPALGEFTGQISDPRTGEVLWSQSPDKPRVPASNAKVLTGAAALLGLPHDKRLTTKVVVGRSGQLILKGAGDPTLSAQPTGADTFYTDPGRIADLAAQIKKSGTDVSSVAVDTSLFSGPSMNKNWERADIAGGDITPIESLIVDGGRTKDPLDEFSPRTAEPAKVAGQALADALGVDFDDEVRADSAARVVASVKSAPLQTRVEDMLRFSDNVLAETLAIELSVARGGPASLSGGADAVRATLADAGFSIDGVTMDDSSGLSYDNRVSATILDTVMSAASGPESAESTTSSGAPGSGSGQGVSAKNRTLIRPLLDGLPIAAGTGTLADRFDPSSNPGAGWARAKTGTLTGVSSLTGIVQTVDGRVLSYALISGGTSPADARPALDAVVGDLRECGCR